MNIKLVLTAAMIVLGGAVFWVGLNSQAINNNLRSQNELLEQELSQLNERDISVDDDVDPDKYQAVFLDNGQVYFGKLEDGKSNAQVALRDIYYLQGADEYSQADTGNEELSLAKLGDELHGPEDAMYIPVDKILFWENLSDSGEVAQAIRDHKAN